MVICALEYRYGSEEMRCIVSRENFVRKLIEVEIALLGALADAGLAPRHCEEIVKRCASNIDPKDVDRLEQSIGHDIAALAILMAERCGECGKYVHLGATSYDIVDTAWSLVLREALSLIKRRLASIIEKLATLADRHRHTLMVGRTHGQHALPITLGFKFANYVYELSRSLERLIECEKRVIRAKISGAVGTMAAWGSKGFVVEQGVCRRLGLDPHIISTQVAPRDGFAELASVLAILASQLDRFAIEVRELSRPEIDELVEGVERVGSSTMPHKRNPVISERISSLAKVMRSLVIATLENVPLWHERDLSNSAAERIVIPHMLLVMDQMLLDFEKLLNVLKAKPENMVKNLEVTRGLIASECLMIKLVERGYPRHEAHALLMKLSKRVYEEGKHFREVVSEALRNVLSDEDVDACFDYSRYLGMANELIDRAIDYARKILENVRSGAPT